MNIKEMVGTTVAVLSLMGIGYTIALRGQYLVDGGIAKAIAQEVVEDEAKERLEFQLEYKLNQLRPLQRIPKAERSEEDQDTIDDLKAQIAAIKCRLGKTEYCNANSHSEE